MTSKDDDTDKEEIALFRQMMRDVKPLQGTKKVIQPKDKASADKKLLKKSAYEAFVVKEGSFTLTSSFSYTIGPEDELSFARPTMPQARLRQLQKGLIPWQKKLDLHGLTAEQAEAVLKDFMQQIAEGGERCLLIIHGKGSLRGEFPVLKNLLHHWLPQFPQVLAFYSALPKHGGKGAVYVLIKRRVRI